MMILSIPTLAALLTLPTAEPLAPLPPAAPYGYRWQPAYSIDKKPRPPLECYAPQPGDIFLYSDTNTFWTILYLIGRSLPVPGHTGIVVRMTNGDLGVLEAGYNDTPITKITPIEQRLAEYPGTIWIRGRKTPLTDEQSVKLTEFALAVENRKYALGRFALQLTPVRARGPVRTVFFGKPKGTDGRLMCSEATVEAIVYAGLIDRETARPAATYPRDMFFDSSPVPYLNKHFNLGCAGWDIPAMWTRDGGPVEKKPFKAFGLR